MCIETNHQPTPLGALGDLAVKRSADRLEATVNEWTWKTPAMRAMTLDVCRLALARGMDSEFSALDLPKRGASAQGGTGIAGSVFTQLRKAGIIGFAVIWADGQAFPKTVTNDGGNPIRLYRLLSAPLARALIHRHSPAECAPAVQAEFDIVGRACSRAARDLPAATEAA
jgi:hypothetical protein